MKRMKKLLACALAALLLILPAAMAEESAMVEAHTITIENPSMTMMGIPMADLDGLSLETTYAGDANDCALLLRLLGGEEVAAEGYALFDGRQLVLGADGLTDTYAVPMEKMMGGDMSSQISDEDMEMLAQLYSPDTYTAIFEATFASTEGLYEAMMADSTDLGTQTVEIGGVAMEAQGISCTITAEMTKEYTASLDEALAQIPFFAMAMEQAETALSPDGYNDEKNAAVAAERKSQVGTGDRSERIRTYNFPQGRVTDHRIGLTLYKLDQVLDGDLDEIIDALTLADQAEKLRASAEEA